MSLSLNFFLVSIFLFSQLLNTQVIIYPLIILTLTYHLFIKKYNLDFKLIISIFTYLLIILLSIIMLQFRNSSFEFTFYSLRFFLGIGLVYFFFKISNFEINKTHIIILIIMVFYEVLYMTFFKLPPLYWYIVIDDIPFWMERTRLDLLNNLSIYASLGLALNSSISSVITVVILFLLLREKKINQYLKFFTFISMFMYMSFSGYIALFVATFFSQFKKISIFTKSIIILLIIILFTFTNNNFLGFSTFESVLNQINIKFDSITSLDFMDFIFGVNLIDFSSDMIGGDFIIFSFIQSLGFLIFFLFMIWLFFSCEKKNIFLLIIGIIMSLHYGVIFNITGQIFFAALMSNKINLKLK